MPVKADGWRRAMADAYRGNLSQLVHQDMTPGDTFLFVSRKVEEWRRAAASAYWIPPQWASLPLTVAYNQEVHPSLPDIARGFARAGNSAYWIWDRFEIPNEPIHQAFSNLRERTRVYPRPPYRLTNAPVPPDIEQTLPGLELPSTAKGYRRAGDYRCQSNFVIPDEPQQSAVRSVPESATGYPMAGSYALAAYSVVGDATAVSNAVNLPECARSHPRAADGYFVAIKAPVASLPTTGKPLTAELAPGSKRASTESYTINIKLIVEGLPALSNGVVMPHRADGYRRAGVEGYDINESFVVQSEPPRVSHITESASGSRRAADGYLVAIAPNPANAPPISIGVSIPDRIYAYRRAGDGYGITVSFAPQSEILPYKTLPHKADGPRRASDYKLINTTPIQSESIAHEVVHVPDRTYTAKRAGDGYNITSKVPVQDEPEPINGLVIPSVARGYQRSRDYTLVATFVPQAEPHYPSVRSITEQVYSPRRAASYDILHPPQSANEATAATFVNAPSVARAYARTSPNAYAVAQSFVVQAEPQQANVRTIPDKADPPKRSLNFVYWIAQSFVVQSEPQAAHVRCPKRADGPQRAANLAYRVSDPRATLATDDGFGDQAVDTNLGFVGARITKAAR